MSELDCFEGVNASLRASLHQVDLKGSLWQIALIYFEPMQCQH